jgi:hypothetical protein
MAETISAAALPDRYQQYYDSLLSQLTASTPKISYTEQPESKIKAGIQASLQPSLNQAIKARQAQTNTARASLDADAAARGMGASTWVTDAKSRLGNSEASDIMTLRGNYGTTLAQQLASQYAAERQQKLAADQFNAQQQAAAMPNALNMAWNLYQQWLSEQGGSGRGGNPNPNPEVDPEEARKAAIREAVRLMKYNRYHKIGIYAEPVPEPEPEPTTPIRRVTESGGIVRRTT